MTQEHATYNTSKVKHMPNLMTVTCKIQKVLFHIIYILFIGEILGLFTNCDCFDSQPHVNICVVISEAKRYRNVELFLVNES